MQKAKVFTDKGISDNTIAKGHPFRSILDHCVTLDALKDIIRNCPPLKQEQVLLLLVVSQKS